MNCMRKMHAVTLLPTTLLAATGACAKPQAHAEPERITTFSAYRNDTLRQLRAGQTAEGASAEARVMLNGPREWRPVASGRSSRPDKGILLVHGLRDSPWSFNDVAAEVAKRGFLVRTVLRPVTERIHRTCSVSISINGAAWCGSKYPLCGRTSGRCISGASLREPIS